MRLSRTAWLIIGIGIFVIAAAGVYVLYQDQANERQEAEDLLALAEETMPELLSEKIDLEDELAQKEDELAQWNDAISQLEEQLALAEIKLGQVQEGFPASVESIEYEEILFAFAYNSNVELVILNASEPGSAEVEGINFSATQLSIEVRGEVADILNYIHTIVTNEDFKTAILEPVNITIPEPLSDAQIDDIEEGIRAELTAGAMAEITTEEMVGFILEAIVEVTGQRVDVLTVEEIAETIREEIAGSLEGNYDVLLAGELAELIEQHIAGSIIGTIVQPIADEIAGLILEVEEDESIEEVLEDLLGEDIAELLGEAIAGALPGDINGLLNEYIAGLIEAKMVNSVANMVEESMGEIMPEMIEKKEMPSASLTLFIYAYPGEVG